MQLPWLLVDIVADEASEHVFQPPSQLESKSDPQVELDAQAASASDHVLYSVEPRVPLQ